MSQLGSSTHRSVFQFPRRHAVTDEWEHVISIPLEIFRRIDCTRFSTSVRCRCSLRVEEVFPTPHFLHFNTWRLIQSLEKKWSLKLSNIFLDTCDIELSTKTSVRDGKMHESKIFILMSDYPPCKIYLLECVWTLLASAEMNQKLVEDIPSSPLPPETREYVDFVPNNNKTMNKNVVYLLSDISWIFLLCSLLFVLLVGLAACGCRKYNLSVPILDKYVDCSLSTYIGC